MIYLGIDYGEKRVGLAKASSEMKIATPLATFENNTDLMDRLAEIVRVESIDQIVVGLPVSFDGQEHSLAKVVRDFGQKLERATDQQVFFENEVLSSKMASRHSNKVDESSAALILQTFLSATIN